MVCARRVTRCTLRAKGSEGDWVKVRFLLWILFPSNLLFFYSFALLLLFFCSYSLFLLRQENGWIVELRSERLIDVVVLWMEGVMEGGKAKETKEAKRRRGERGEKGRKRKQRGRTQRRGSWYSTIGVFWVLESKG